MDRRRFIFTLIGSAVSAIASKVLPKKENLYSARVSPPEGHYFPLHGAHDFSDTGVIYQDGDCRLWFTPDLSAPNPAWAEVKS